MPLGLTKAQEQVYRAHLFSSHDFTVALDVLNQDGKVLSSIIPTFLDGQVNLSRSTDSVNRSATFSCFDPDHSLGMDSSSPWDGAVFADRQIRARHVTYVPGLAAFVTAVPFVGPSVKIGRDGDLLSIEAQDRSSLAMTPCPPLKVKKGTNCVAAIRKIMSERTGETRFRLPANSTKRLPETFNVGWSDEATPWKVCQRIAALLGMQLFYSCDGYLTLRPLPASPVLTLTDAELTSRVTVEDDLTETKNHVRVSGSLPPKKTGGKAGSVTRTASLPPSHAMRHNHIGRRKADGTIVPRYLPLLIDGESFKTASAAQQLANRKLASNQGMSVGTGTSCIPFFDGDVGDMVELLTATGAIRIRLDDTAIPLGVSGDQTLGYTRTVSKPQGVR